jgi:hypothetical protein
MAFSYAPGSQTPGYSGADQRKAVADLCEADVFELPVSQLMVQRFNGLFIRTGVTDARLQWR